jgi:hypothetical protein
MKKLNKILLMKSVQIITTGWQEFLTSKYFWFPIGTIVAGTAIYYNLDSIKSGANNLPIPGVVITAYVKFKYWLPSWARRGPFADPFEGIPPRTGTDIAQMDTFETAIDSKHASEAFRFRNSGDEPRTPTPPHLPTGMNTYFKDSGFE